MITKKQAADVIAQNLLEDITEEMIIIKNLSECRTLVAITSGPHIGDAYMIHDNEIYAFEPTKIVAEYGEEEYTFQ
jgi:hypothetical protein